jgi:hypothetical protein
VTLHANQSVVIDEYKGINQLNFTLVLCGSAALETGNNRETEQLRPGTSVNLPNLLDYKLKIKSSDISLLVVELPTSNF